MADIVNQAGWTAAAANGFLPINPILWPIQIGIFIVACIFLALAFHPNGWLVVFGGYIIQGAIITLALKGFLNIFGKLVGV